MLRRIASRALHLRSVLAQAKAAWHLTGRAVTAQLIELIGLRRATGMTAREYFLYELYRPGRSAVEKRQYLTRTLHERYLAPLDPPEYGALFFDKSIFTRYFRTAGLPTPETFGIYHTLFGQTEKGESLKTQADLARFLEEHPHDGLVVKPVRGGCGRDVYVFHNRGAVRTTLIHVNGQEFSLDLLAERLSIDEPFAHPGFLFEEAISQHADVARINAATLNTLRAVTLIDCQGATHVVGASLKIGLDNSGVDSMVEHHLCAAVDWRTGGVGPAWMLQGIEFVPVDRHPASGQEINGLTLPDWPRVQSLVERAAQTVPQVRSVGWDVGFSQDGPLLIEGNEIWGEEILQIPLRRGIWTPELRAIIG